MKKIISFIVYFNKETGKFESIYNNFANKDDNGKINVVNEGYSYLSKLLEKKGVFDESNVVAGIFSEDENGNIFIDGLKYQSNTFIISKNIVDEAKKNKRSVQEERQYISNVIIEFVKGSVKEDNFKQILRKVISNHYLNIPDIYSQKTK